MSILELPKDALLALTDAQLEQLIGRLAEAEVTACGGSAGDVRFSGSITAPDGGVDVRVDVKTEPFTSSFIPKPNTIFQSKKPNMPAGSITGEMRPKGALADVISQQCEAGGAYVIVSLGDDCTEPNLKARQEAMRAAVVGHPKADAIHLDFYDRFKLHQWLRQHPSVMLWVRLLLGQPLSGWQSYGRWTNVPTAMTDDLILAPGVSVILPGQRHQKLPIEQAINPTRQLILSSKKAIRIAGLSGVGKTRFVQALFDEQIGQDALDRTSVVYVDTGADPVPSARQMIDHLAQDGRTATVVIDNCPPALHADLASRITRSENRIKLITVEYDIRDDKPQTTEVIQIEADGPEIAEALVLRRYPGIGQANAHRVAEFSSGNTRVALALAERVEVGESLAHLSDANLFDRLFQQRHGEDGRLCEHAEVLSLVYSFSIEAAEGEADELGILGSLCAISGDVLYRSMRALVDRQIAQRRGRWRAVLPHAIANRLATSALDRIRPQTLRATFEAPGHERLLTSFAHRLGLMHEHPIAQQIVQGWLAPGGMLVPIIGLDDRKARILDYVAPVCPEALLDRIELELMAPGFGGLEVRSNPRRTTILRMLVALAYEPIAFDRCVNLLLRIAHHEDPANNHDSVRDKIVQLFQPYLSGTHATPRQRALIMRSTLWSAEPKLRSLGLKMLSKALGGPSWTGMGMGEFGARPRDFGFEPNRSQLMEWRNQFINLAVRAGLDPDPDLSRRAREVLANAFRGLWSHAEVRNKLAEAATTLNDQRPWTDGWKAIQSTIFFDYRRKSADLNPTPVQPGLLTLRDLLAPKDLVSNIRTHLLGRNQDLWALDPGFDHDDTSKYQNAQQRMTERIAGFGEQFGLSELGVDQLGAEIFSTSYMPFGHAFGSGLARGSNDPTGRWAELVEVLRRSGVTNYNCSVFSGFLEEVGRLHQGLDRQILDGCLADPLLRPAIVMLHPSHDFGEADLDRCMRALEQPDVGAWGYGILFWRKEFASLPKAKVLELATRLLEKPDGDRVVLDALHMKLHDTDKTVDVLGHDLRRIALTAASSQLNRDRDGNNDRFDYEMAEVLRPSLTFEGNEAEKSAWLDAIFSSVDNHYGYAPGYDEAMQVTAEGVTEDFLDRAFSGEERQRELRLHFLGHGGLRRSLLATSDVGRIIEWCRAKADPEIWAGVATALDVFETSGDEKTVVITERCMRFLEACPNPVLVLNSFADRITPNGWSGSKADIMDRNTNALAALNEHPEPRIAEATRRVVVEARTWITKERDRERREDEASEQTFE
ncbi:hypothetical protein [Tabrizicola sp.]|uniref:hypothetical protein n=1 Tax=Tabrizicola sp. TaxID=2005166 RepID=UPI0035B095E6